MLSSINSSSALAVILYTYLCISALFILKHLKMDLIPHIQDKVFSSRRSIQTDEEVVSLRETVRHQDEVINANKKRITQLEAEVEELKRNNQDLKAKVDEHDGAKQETNEVFSSYECLIEKLMREYQVANGERELARNHLANLELAFHDLIEKYERAKTIISGYEGNERTFMEHMGKFEVAVERIECKYSDFKRYAVEKLNEANKQLEKNDREYVTEVTKLKSKIIQSHVKVKELERQISGLSIKAGRNGFKNENSIFEPLVNNIG